MVLDEKPDEKPDVKPDEAAFEPSSVQSDVQPRVPSVEERRLLRKLDRRILPITCLLYLFACQYFNFDWFSLTFLTYRPTLDLDRSNLGNARLQGLAQDALGGDPKGKRFDLVNSIFFLSYVGSRIPAVRMRNVPKSHFGSR